MFLRDKLKRRKLNPKAEKFSTSSMLKEPSTSENYYNELAEQDENMDEGEQSATSEAPNPANSTKQILKCANCKQQHLADEYDCPKRKEYIALKNRISNRSQPNKRQPGADYNLSQANFPQLVSTAVAPHNRSNQFSRPLPSYSSVVRNNLNSNRNNANINVQTDLFSPQEIMELTNELIVQLAQCNSRADQFNVIVDLSVKFLYG
ncbi:unnamed protein product [Hermetia illucens]|uniref:Uncharacterized protein n=1 Tax=Hermetia illucens TaxID=343691 RepID=A0A7R8UPA4_HERIL|nr:unnamed protein product [Hermetia illucens]